MNILLFEDLCESSSVARVILTLKSVYLALSERNTKIVECNGMYKTTPSSYNLVYASSVYNCSIYETK